MVWGIGQMKLMSLNVSLRQIDIHIRTTAQLSVIPQLSIIWKSYINTGATALIDILAWQIRAPWFQMNKENTQKYNHVFCRTYQLRICNKCTYPDILYSSRMNEQSSYPILNQHFWSKYNKW